jgi:hypothetical protein
MNRRQLFAVFTGLFASLFVPRRRRIAGKISQQQLDNFAEYSAPCFGNLSPQSGRLMKLRGLDGNLVIVDRITWKTLAAKV